MSKRGNTQIRRGIEIPRHMRKTQGPGQQQDIHSLTDEWKTDSDKVRKIKWRIRHVLRAQQSMRISRKFNKVTLPKVTK